MSENPENPTEPPQDDLPPRTQDDPQDGGGQGHANAEAAKWRRQLRATEAERDTLASRLDDYDRAEVERLAADRLASPADVWLASSIEQMRKDDGTLDPAMVDAELIRLLTEKPHWKKPIVPDLHQGARDDVPEAPSFGQSVKRALTGR